MIPIWSLITGREKHYIHISNVHIPNQILSSFWLLMDHKHHAHNYTCMLYVAYKFPNLFSIVSLFFFQINQMRSTGYKHHSPSFLTDQGLNFTRDPHIRLPCIPYCSTSSTEYYRSGSLLHPPSLRRHSSLQFMRLNLSHIRVRVLSSL